MNIILSKTKRFIEKTCNIEITRPKSKIPIINQSVVIDKEIIFVAIPKTGSTSVRSQIRQEGSPVISNPHLNIMQIKDLIYVYMLETTLIKYRSFPNESIIDDAAIRRKAKELFDSFFKFSAVRNPWARAVSLYFRREGRSVRDKMSFEEFCAQHFYASDTCNRATLHKNQYDWLCDETGTNLMDYVYKVENFRTAIQDIRELTKGRLQLKEAHENRNPDSLSGNYRDMYNDATRKMIAERFGKDIDIFKYTF